MEKYDLKGFNYKEIIEESKIFNLADRREYFNLILKEWKLNPPRLDPNGELDPSFEDRINEELRELNFLESTGKKDWNGSKGDFANFVNDEYYSNQKKYASLKDATKQLFAQYYFQWKDWDVEQCYENVKKK
jgi:hypothetical protein